MYSSKKKAAVLVIFLIITDAAAFFDLFPSYEGEKGQKCFYDIGKDREKEKDIMKVFEPFKLGNLELKNRMVVSAMVTNYCSPDGRATENLLLITSIRPEAAGG